MISNVAMNSTEAVGGAASAPGESVDTGDTGAFDALLALQSVSGEDTVTDLAALAAYADDLLLMQPGRAHFVTAVLAYLNIGTGALRYGSL